MNLMVTGSAGFIGRNLVARLSREKGVTVIGYDVQNLEQELVEGLAVADLVYHLAGINRPSDESEFTTGNVSFTAKVCQHLLDLDRPIPIVLSSSIQATLDNPYGISKRQAEGVVKHYAEESGARAAIYRLNNVFGKWCRPNYNSVVATFCYNVAHDLSITISDPNKEMAFVYIDDVVEHFWAEAQAADPAGVYYRDVSPVHCVTLGRLADLIRSFREMRATGLLPDLADPFVRKLYGTYVAYLDEGDFAYNLDRKCDPRGCLAEFVKAPTFGQIFVSRTKPGITRGNHYHHTKAEKFLVLQGKALIRFRHIEHREVIEYNINGEDFRVVDIPTGYTHSIENVGDGELVTLFWASEPFDPANPETCYVPVVVSDSEVN